MKEVKVNAYVNMKFKMELEDWEDINKAFYKWLEGLGDYTEAEVSVVNSSIVSHTKPFELQELAKYSNQYVYVSPEFVKGEMQDVLNVYIPDESEAIDILDDMLSDDYRRIQLYIFMGNSELASYLPSSLHVKQDAETELFDNLSSSRTKTLRLLGKTNQLRVVTKVEKIIFP